jgi:RibD C-terminal domain
MRKVIASEFVSLDGVMEDPGGAEGSHYGGWSFAYFNEELGRAIGDGFAASDAMLMGRRTYEEWAAFWPKQDPEENPDAGQMNNVSKCVVSKTLEEPPGVAELNADRGGCNGGDLRTQAASRQGHRDLRQRRPRPVAAWGRPDRRAEALGPPDRGGRREAPLRGGGDRIALELVDSSTFSTGVVYLTYRPAEKEAE